MGVRSRITGLLTCGASVLAFFSLRFSESIVLRMLGDLGSDIPRLAVVALSLTGNRFLIPFLLVCIGAIVVSEVTVRTGSTRLLVQMAVLLLVVALLALALVGFFISFYIPDVHID
jgi:hypothetical protein